MAQHNEFGKKGEELAVRFLEKTGYTVLERNYHFQKAELDIIALKDEVLAVVEVKARSENALTAPEDAITPKKIKLLTAATDAYILRNDMDVEVRFDIISVTSAKGRYEIVHTEDAFYHF